MRYELLVLDVGGVCIDEEGATDPTVAGVIDAAKERGLTVAVLSNELDNATIATHPLLQRVDHVVSCNRGIQKPDRRAFQRVLLLTGIDADRTLVVDDAGDNVRGAQAAGTTALHFDVDDRAASWATVRVELGLG